MIKIKRAYEPVEKSDGVRILVDRLWPRGKSKHELAIDEWLKEVSPSTELRKWFSHKPDRWHEFLDKYFEELDKLEDICAQLRTNAKRQSVTLVYAAKDSKHNNAVALKQYLERHEGD
jgi:uncharacterized protein YeaO (DUF488 family)